MTPYGYHNSEINHMSGDDRKNAREAIRQAKLVRQQAREEAAGSQGEVPAARPRAWHRVVAWAKLSAPRAYLRTLRTHSQ